MLVTNNFVCIFERKQLTDSSTTLHVGKSRFRHTILEFHFCLKYTSSMHLWRSSVAS